MKRLFKRQIHKLLLTVPKIEDDYVDVHSLVLLLNTHNYLALIKRAGGLYGRILTEVVSTDRGQDSPIQTD